MQITWLVSLALHRNQCSSVPSPTATCLTRSDVSKDFPAHHDTWWRHWAGKAEMKFHEWQLLLKKNLSAVRPHGRLCVCMYIYVALYCKICWREPHSLKLVSRLPSDASLWCLKAGFLRMTLHVGNPGPPIPCWEWASKEEGCRERETITHHHGTHAPLHRDTPRHPCRPLPTEFALKTSETWCPLALCCWRRQALIKPHSGPSRMPGSSMTTLYPPAPQQTLADNANAPVSCDTPVWL